jgi:predicted Zn-dependent peptidase
MAHLLEHLIFKGSRNFPDPAREFKARGFQINGTTWLDRTNYYLTFPASDDNIRWALGVERRRHGQFVHRPEGPRYRDDGCPQ